MGIDYSGLLLKGLAGSLPVLLAMWPLWLLAGGIYALKIFLTVLEQRRLAASGIGDIDQMDGKTFEKRLEVLFDSLGYTVERTPYQGDWGADLVLRKAGVRTAVQAKRYKKSVGVRAVQEAVASKAKYNCTEAMVVTNSRFTRSAQELARVNGVALWDRDRLIRALREAQPGTQQAPQTVKPPIEVPAALVRFTPPQPSPARQPALEVCALCGAALSPRVVAFCREHAGRFAGGLYCFPHQRLFESNSLHRS